MTTEQKHALIEKSLFDRCWRYFPDAMGCCDYGSGRYVLYSDSKCKVSAPHWHLEAEVWPDELEHGSYNPPDYSSSLDLCHRAEMQIISLGRSWHYARALLRVTDEPAFATAITRVKAMVQLIQEFELKAAEAAVVRAAMVWSAAADAPRHGFDMEAERTARTAVFDAVAKLREVKEK